MTSLRTTIAAAAIAALLAAGTWWHLARVHAAERAVHAHYAQVLAEINAKTAAAAAQFRATESTWRTAFEKEAKDGQDRIDTARRAAAAAGAERSRLLGAIDRYRAAARASQGAGAARAGQGEPGAEPIDLLASLLDRADSAAGELASYADELHAAGLTCERAADALTTAQP